MLDEPADKDGGATASDGIGAKRCGIVASAGVVQLRDHGHGKHAIGWAGWSYDHLWDP